MCARVYVLVSAVSCSTALFVTVVMRVRASGPLHPLIELFAMYARDSGERYTVGSSRAPRGPICNGYGRVRDMNTGSSCEETPIGPCKYQRQHG